VAESRRFRARISILEASCRGVGGGDNAPAARFIGNVHEYLRNALDPSISNLWRRLLRLRMYSYSRASCSFAYIGTPTQGYGYESGDPYTSFLPPAVPVVDEDDPTIRAMVIVRENTEKVGQEYIGPLLVLSGEDYAALSFQALHDRICDALRGRRPRLVAEVVNRDAGRLLFADGSVKESPAHRKSSERNQEP